MLAHLSPLRMRGGAAAPEADLDWLLWSAWGAALVDDDDATIDAVNIRQDEDPTVDVGELEIQNSGRLDIGSYDSELLVGNVHMHNSYLIAGSEAEPVE